MEYSAAPVDLDRMWRYRLGRLHAELEQRDTAGLLLFDPINTRYATNATNTKERIDRTAQGVAGRLGDPTPPPWPRSNRGLGNLRPRVERPKV